MEEGGKRRFCLFSPMCMAPICMAPMRMAPRLPFPFVHTCKYHQAEAVKVRIEQIRRSAEKANTQFDKDKAVERVAALGGGIARIKVGAATETELRDKKLRYEDALNSVKSAQELGIVPGGGVTMAFLETSMRDKLIAAMDDEDEVQGALIMLRVSEHGGGCRPVHGCYMQH